MSKVLDELEAAEKAATPGSWVMSGVYVYYQRLNEDDNPDDIEVAKTFRKPDLALIVKARNALPVLLRVARAAKEYRKAEWAAQRAAHSDDAYHRAQVAQEVEQADDELDAALAALEEHTNV